MTVLLDGIANLVAAIHLAYFLFVVGGTAAIVIGRTLGWAWIRNLPFRILHLAAVYVVLLENTFGIPCLLNVTQSALRRAAGEPAEATTGVAGVLDGLLFRTIPGELLNVMYWSLGVGLLVMLYVVPPRQRSRHAEAAAPRMRSEAKGGIPVRARRTILPLLAALAIPIAAVAQGDPDALYRERANVTRAREAIDIWEARLKANPRDFESAWKISRATYWLGKHEERDAGRRTLERGIAAGRQATTLEPNRPEGYFWMAASMGALAESYGIGQGLRYRGPIKEALEKALKIDPAFLDGSADRALGRWYHMVPGLFGGSEAKSEEHLRKSLTYKPDSILSMHFLAETLFERDKDVEAIALLEKIATAPPHPDFVPEDLEIKQKAAEELARRTKAKR